MAQPSAPPFEWISFVNPYHNSGNIIIYFPAKMLYKELSRITVVQTIFPDDLQTQWYIDYLSSPSSFNVPLEVGIINYSIHNYPGVSRLYFTNGRHRTAALAKLGMETVPLSCNELTAAALKIIEAENEYNAWPSNAKYAIQIGTRRWGREK